MGRGIRKYGTGKLLSATGRGAGEDYANDIGEVAVKQCSDCGGIVGNLSHDFGSLCPKNKGFEGGRSEVTPSPRSYEVTPDGFIVHYDYVSKYPKYEPPFSFDKETLDNIRPYCLSECKALSHLARKLVDAHTDADLKPIKLRVAAYTGRILPDVRR